MAKASREEQTQRTQQTPGAAHRPRLPRSVASVLSVLSFCCTAQELWRADFAKPDLPQPLQVNQCIPGSLDDAKRAEAARYGTTMLAEAGFGWMGWSVKEGKAVSTRRDRYDGNGVDGTGFHAWFTAQNTLRPGLEFLLDKPLLQAPWEPAAK